MAAGAFDSEWECHNRLVHRIFVGWRGVVSSLPSCTVTTAFDYGNRAQKRNTVCISGLPNQRDWHGLGIRPEPGSYAN